MKNLLIQAFTFDAEVKITGIEKSPENEVKSKRNSNTFAMPASFGMIIADLSGNAPIHQGLSNIPFISAY